MTWGTSKYKMKGVHEIAMENGRVVVTGHAAEVGIVGWSMGGGHSPLSLLHGLGVDQMLEVELVGPDGSHIIANINGTTAVSPDMKMVEFTENNDLFWAMRGGGAGPWGAVTAMTIKLHKPKDDCQTNCYQTTTAVWEGSFVEGDMGQMAIDIAQQVLPFLANPSVPFSGYFIFSALEELRYSVMLAEMMYVGKPDDPEARLLAETFGQLYPEKLSWYESSFDTYFEKTLTQAPETTYVSSQFPVWTSVLLNRTILENPDELISTMFSLWVPRCMNFGAYNGTCNLSYQMHFTLPKDDDDVEDTSVAKKFRQADMHMTTNTGFNLFGISSEESTRWIHEVLSPALYKYGAGSYYSESEYSMKNGQWQNRLWDQETYDRLLAIKQTWDPEHVFSCRHCVGDESPALQVNEQTMPSWRFFK